nr:MAG TPA: Orsellinic acid biosynthesis cluster protein [Caudoviricetes sp.]
MKISVTTPPTKRVEVVKIKNQGLQCGECGYAHATQLKK